MGLDANLGEGRGIQGLEQSKNNGAGVLAQMLSGSAEHEALLEKNKDKQTNRQN